MYGQSQKKDPLSDPKIAALMASLGATTDEEDNKAIKEKKIPHPPITFEEFLEEEKIDEWPQRLTSEGVLDLSEINANLWTHDEILKELQEKAPLEITALYDLEEELNAYAKKLEAFSAYIVSNEQLPSTIREKLFHAPKPEELEKAVDSDAVTLHHSRRKKKDPKQAMVEAMQASRSKNIDYVSYPGFRKNELTELPSQLEAPQLLNKITEAQSFNKGFGQLWKKIFLSEASVALLQDTFWWFFLENFEHNPIAQDKIFTRIADSYVSLFLSINSDIRDKILQVFPRCFAQCVYLTFREAFPESSNRLAEEFITEISCTISEWISGVKPPVNSWKRWPWEKICSPPGESKSQSLQQPEKERTLGVRRASAYIRDLEMDLLSAIPVETSDSALTSNDKNGIVLTVPDEERVKEESSATSGKSRKQESRSEVNTSRPIAVGTPLSAQTKSLGAKPTNQEESAQTGPGPDFERVMFNLGGRSPLVAHYLHMKHLRGMNMVGKQMRRTEVLQEPAPAPTFQEVIRHAQKVIKEVHTKQARMIALTQEEKTKQERIRRAAVKETKLLQQSLTDPIEIKIRSDRVLDQALGGGLHRPSSYGRIKSPNPKQEDLLSEHPDSLPGNNI